MSAFFAGHFIAVHRDRRKEFNAAADRFAGIINKGTLGEIPFADFVDFSRFLSGRTLRKYNATLELYKDASYRPKREYDGTIDLRTTGLPDMRNATEAARYLDELSSFAKRK